jgi:hypothetical protein
VVGLSREEERGELGQGMKRSLRSHLSLRTSAADLLRWFWFGATVFNFGSRFSVVHQKVLKISVVFGFRAGLEAVYAP